MLRAEPFSNYTEQSGLSQSQLKYLLKCPALFKHHILDGNNDFDSVALKTGRILHKLVLEPSDFDKEFFVTEKIRRSGKVWDEMQQMAAGKDIIFEEDIKSVSDMRDQILKHEYAAKLLKDSINEVSIYWKHKETGIDCKSRIDAIKKAGDDVFLIDIKTARSVTESSFMHSIFTYGYHIQAAFYMDAYYTATKIMPNFFIIIAVDKTAPHLVAIYIFKNDSAALEFGRQQYERLLNIYSDCIDQDKWEDAYNEPYAVYIPPVFLK